MKKVQNFQKKLIRMDQLLSFNKQDIKYEILREALEFMTEIGSSISVLFLFLTISIVIDWKLIFLFLPIYLFQVLVVETVKLTFRRKHPKNEVGFLQLPISFFGCFLLNRNRFTDWHPYLCLLNFT